VFVSRLLTLLLCYLITISPVMIAGSGPVMAATTSAAGGGQIVSAALTPVEDAATTGERARYGSLSTAVRKPAPACACPGGDCRVLASADGQTIAHLDQYQLGTLGLGFLAGIAAADLVTTGGVGTVGMLMKGGISALAVMSLGQLQDQFGIRKEDLYGAGIGVLAGIALADLIGTGGLGAAAVVGLGGLIGRFVAHESDDGK